MNSPEPRFARIAAMIGDPTPATASAHVAKLVDTELVVVRTQGRHRYVRLADDDIAHALEALSLVAERDARADKWTQGPYKPLKAARTCYRHMAGELGVALFEGMLARGVLAPCDGYFTVSEPGCATLGSMGIEVPAIVGPVAGRRFAHRCLDWSERRDHLAGGLAVLMLERFLEKRWVVRVPGSRALKTTPEGVRRLSPLAALV